MLKPKDRRAMNLNDFVVLPNSAAKSAKLNARNLRELKTETGSLAQESEEMEEKLNQLRERMSREKEERGHSGGFRWKSGQHGPLNSSTMLINAKKNKDSRLQKVTNKLSAGKVKIRVLKDEPLTALVQPPPPSPAPVGPRTMRKNKLKGTTCGQCEVRTAGVMCAECSEDYCISCFSKFHQKGALKFHTMIPIQTELQTHVSTQDVVSCLQTQANPSHYSTTFSSPNPRPNSERNHSSLSNAFGDQRPGNRNAVVSEHMLMHNDSSQVLVVRHEDTNNMEAAEEEPSLLNGTFDEEESSRSFQEALRQWREEGKTTTQERMWIPFRSVTVADVPTQVDLSPDRGGAGRRVPVRVEFSEHGLTFLDRLLLKKHRRTPIELPPPVMDTNVKALPENPEKEPESSLTADEEEFHSYFASLFAVPNNIQRSEPHNITLEASLSIEVLDEEDRSVEAERKTFDRIVPAHQNKQTAGPKSVVSSSHLQTAPSSTEPSPLSRNAEQTKTTVTVRSALSPKPPARTTAAETPGNVSTSIKTATSKTKKPNCSQTGHKAKAGHGSPQSPLLSSSVPLSRTQTPKSSYTPLSFPPNDSPSTSRSLTSEEHRSYPNISPALRSTFTLTPSSSSDSALLPKIYPSGSLQQSTRSSLKSPKQSRHSLSDLKTVLSDNQAQSPMSHTPPCPKTSIVSSISSETNNPMSHKASVKTIPKSSSLSMSGSSEDVFSRSRLSHDDTHGDAAVFLSFHRMTIDHESMSQQYTQHVLSDPSQRLNDTQSPVLTGKDGALSTGYSKESTFGLIQEYHNALKSIQDSEDEMSSDSLGLALCEDDFSDEDAEVHSRLESGRSSDDRGSPASVHLGDPFVPADEERERDLRTDEAEQLSEPSSAMHSHRSELEHLSDVDGFQSPYLDTNPIHNLRQKWTAELAPAVRPLSQAAQEIMEICDVDRTGCEDPDMEADTTAHTISRLEQELRLLARETGAEVLMVATGNSGREDPRGNRHFTRSRMSKEELEEEEAVQSDRQSVLLLP